MYADDNIHCFNKDSDNVVFSCNVMSILNKDLNNINLDDTNYGKNDPETIIQVFWFGVLNLKNAIRN